MDDLTITRLCAEAIGYAKDYYVDGRHVMFRNGTQYDPLHDDAQAMVLVKRFKLFISYSKGKWTVSTGIGGHDKTGAQYTDINRAICECVAKMQAAK